MQQEIKVKNGQSIYDIALFCYNDASLVYDLITENPIIDDILMDLTALTLVYTPKKVVKYEAKENTQKANKLVTIKQEQSIFDLSLQQYGSIDFVYNLIENNSFIESILSNDINSNILANVDEKNYVTEFYNKNGTIVGTNIPKTSFLLQQNGYYILQQNGYKILL